MNYKPQFTLRTLFGLVTTVAVTMGVLMFAYYWNWARERREVFPNQVRAVDPPRKKFVDENRLAPWPLRVLGEDSHSIQVYRVDPSKLEQARRLFPEAHIEPPHQSN